jgi:T5SS/PEP-CTERM-associated repeat protein
VGDGRIAASVVNNGTIEALGTVADNVFTPGTLEITGDITGSGAIDLPNLNSILQLDGSVSQAQTIDFGSGSELILNAPGTNFSAPITNLNTGDKIEFNFGAGVTISSARVTSPGTITVVTNTGSYELTNVSFAAGANQTLFVGTDGSNGDGFIQVAPPFVNWVGSVSTDYGTAGNWQGGVVPNATDSVSFLNNPGTITGTGNALSLNIGFYNTNTVETWTFSNATITVAGQPSPPFLPYAIGFWANTVLNGMTLNAAGGTTGIGNQNNVTVTAQSGSHITTAGDSVGTNPGQSGSLVLTGGATTWTEQSGPAVNGSIPGFLSVGFNGPSGNLAGSSGFLTVTSGATLNTGAGATFGGNPGSRGSGTISAGGIWNAHNVTVGQTGAGTLTVNGGTVLATTGYTIGNAATVGGTLHGGTGLLDIGAGGVVKVTEAPQTNSFVVEVGASNGGLTGPTTLSNGTIDVTGAGALLDTNGNPLRIGRFGNGTVTVSQGGSIVAGTPDSNTLAATSIGQLGNGSLTVTDPGSTYTANGFMFVGRGGTGSLTIQNQGKVVVGLDSKPPPTAASASALVREAGARY